MACDLTLGRLEPCKDVVGGIEEVYFINYEDAPFSTFTNSVVAGEEDNIATVSGTPSAFLYEIRGVGSFTQNIQSDRATGTTAFEQVLEITLKKLTAADHKELKLLVYGNPKVIIKDYNGNYFIAGLEHGMDVTGGTIVTGAAMNELSGYTLTLTGMEKKPAPFLDNIPATVGFTVVPGT